MSIPAIAPSPVARLLLELEARKATGGLSVGGRRIVLTEGAIVEVRPHAEDASLGDFLVATGRLSADELERAKRDASAKRQPLEVSLRTQELVPLDVLLDTRRALWLDRFVRGLTAEESAGAQPALLSPEPHPSPGPAISTLSFVLDGLTRRAGYAGDAERVGRLAQAWFEWLDTPQRQRATLWADLGDAPSAVLASSLFPRHPAAPPRIAALVRAGLARLSQRRSNLPPPAPRNPSFAAPASSEGPITARRALAMQLFAPGTQQARPLGIVPVASWFPAASGALNDPLDALERRIAQLEQSEAEGGERARAWLELAAGFRTHFEALDEAARAAREAVAADPSCREALELAASLCSAVGRPDLAYAYETGLTACLDDAASKAQSLVRAAGFAQRADKPGSALRALRQAMELQPEDESLAERYAQALLARGDVEQALQVALQAAERCRPARPEQARALLSWAHEISPFDATVAAEFASVLAAEGYGEAAVAQLARAARHTRDRDAARRLWLSAGVRAELIARPDLAADLLLEAARRAPADDTAFVEPVVTALGASGSLVELAVLAGELAEHVHGAARATCLLRAAGARLELPGEPVLALELCTQALIASPSNQEAPALIEQLAPREPRALCDALERALRAPRENRDDARPLLRRFLRLAATQGLPALERWAWSAWASLTNQGPSPEEQQALELRLARFEAELHTLERALREAPLEARPLAALALADALRQDPAQRGKARKLYGKVLEREPDNQHAQSGLEALLRLEAQAPALSAALWRRAQQSPAGPAKVGALLVLVYHERARAEHELALRALRELLSLAPAHREALLLLQRLGMALRAPALERDALSRRVETSQDPRERARALCAWARLALHEADVPSAVRCAELALAADPRCAEAALMLLEHPALLDPARRAAALRAARVVLGDTPQLLRMLAQACFGTRDARGQLEALETLLRLCPLDPFPALGLGALRVTGRDTRAISASVHTLIEPDRRAETSGEAVRNALSRLWGLGLQREAAELALVAADALGEAADELVTWSVPYVREAEDPRLSRAVLERMVARARGDARRAELRRLAHLCRAQGARAAEARVYLRLLAVEPADAEALDRLTHIYAETRELERLTAVLTLRSNLARDAEERRDRLLSLALVSLELMDDVNAASELVRVALAAEERDGVIVDPPLSELRRGIGLLLASPNPRAAFDLLLELSEECTPPRARAMLEEAVHLAEHDLTDPELALRAAMLGLESHPFHTPFLLHFERLALELSDVATAREVYRHLGESAVGTHGRRAVLYRGARFLERLGALTHALELAEQAFSLHKSEGAVLATLARLAGGTGQYDALLRALVALAAEPTSAPQRGELLCRAAALCEEQLESLEQAAILYSQAFEASGAEAHELSAARSLARIAERDVPLARQLSTRFRDQLTARAKDARHGGERAAALTRLAELTLDLQGAAEEATSYAHAAKQAIEGDSGASDRPREAIVARLQNVQARLPQRKDARPSSPRSSEPAEGTPGGERAMPAPKWSDPSRPASPYGRPSLRETLRPAVSSVPPAHDQLQLAALPVVTGAVEVTTRRSLRVEASVEALTPQEDSIIHALCAGQPEALARLAELCAPTASIEHSAKLCEALLARTRSDLLSVPAIRGLWLLSERAHRRDLRAVTSEILSHIDPASVVTRSGRLPHPQDEATKGALQEARDDGPLAPAFTALYHLFLGGAPLFRRPLAGYGVGTSDFIPSRDDSAYASALRDVSLVLGAEHEAYRKPSGRDLISVVPTYPPSLIIGDGTAQAPMALRFRFGCMFECARPSSVLLATLPREAALTLLAALRAAFGATDQSSSSVDREAAAMAAELWRTLPSSAQKHISTSLRALDQPLSYEALSAAMRLRAARVGLVTACAVDVALAHLELDTAGAEARVPATEAGLAAALTQRPLLAQLLAFSLSDAYLALRSRESS